MNGKVSLRDYEALSAYLDGALDERNRTRLEKRIQSEEVLKQELEVLRRTRVVLRSQPRLRAPRNFTLTPQMAGARQPARYSLGAYPALRLASVLATIFLVLVLAGDLIGSSMRPQTIAASDLPQQAPFAMPGFGMGGGGGGGSDVGSEAALSEEETPVEMPAVEATQVANMNAIPETSTPGAESALQAASPAAVAEEPSLSEPQTPVEETEQLAKDSGNQVVEDGEARQNSWPFIRVLQVLLALMAVGTGLGAFLIRRASIS